MLYTVYIMRTTGRTAYQHFFATFLLKFTDQLIVLTGHVKDMLILNEIHMTCDNFIVLRLYLFIAHH